MIALLMMFMVAAPTNLNDPGFDVAVRVAAAKRLGTDRSDDGLDALLQGLQTRQEDVHAAVVAALRTRRAGVVLIARALDDKRAVDDRITALGGLRALKPAAALQLAPLLKDPVAAIRAASAHTIGTLDVGTVEAALATALNDDDDDVRYFAARALGEVTSDGARMAINTRLRVETDPIVRDALDAARRRQAQP